MFLYYFFFLKLSYKFIDCKKKIVAHQFIKECKIHLEVWEKDFRDSEDLEKN